MSLKEAAVDYPNSISKIISTGMLKTSTKQNSFRTNNFV